MSLSAGHIFMSPVLCHLIELQTGPLTVQSMAAALGFAGVRCISINLVMHALILLAESKLSMISTNILNYI